VNEPVFDQEKLPEESGIEEGASQALESAAEAAQEGLDASEEIIEGTFDDASTTASEEVEGVEETFDAATAEVGEVIDATAQDVSEAWQPEPVEFASLPSEPVIETPASEVSAGAAHAWEPEPARSSAQVPPPVAPREQALSSDDERTWALLAHLSVLLNLVTGILGPVAAIVIYFAFKDRSRYVRYHAMQAFLFQLLWWVGGGILTTILWVTVGVLAVVIVGLCLIPFALVASLLPLGALIYGVIGGIQVSQGQDFRYWLVGDWVRGELTGD
jgi:uncharacterized Tic20 family protein